MGEFFYDILLLKSASKEAFEAQNRQKKISIFFTGQKKSRRCENRAYKPQIKVRKFSVVVVGKKLNEQRKCWLSESDMKRTFRLRGEKSKNLLQTPI